MKKMIPMITIMAIIFLLIVVSPGFSQTEGTGMIQVGSHHIYYDLSTQDDTDKDGIIDKASYFKNNNIVLTIWDEDQDGLPEIWFVYDEEEYLITEAEDINRDGIPDVFSYFNREEEMTKEEKEVSLKTEQPVENPFSGEDSFLESPIPEEVTQSNIFNSDHGQITFTIGEIQLESNQSGNLAWILSLTMQTQADLQLYATEYWFVYPDCPREDVYAYSDLEVITYEYPNNPSRNYEQVLTQTQKRRYLAGQTVSRHFTLPLCMEAYRKYNSTRVNLVQAVEYYLDSEGKVETLEWEYYSP